MTSQPEDFDLEPLNRTQLLVAIALTSIVLLVVSRLWLSLDSVERLPLKVSLTHTAVGLGLGLAITAASTLMFVLWPAYRRSAEFYLKFVLKPLVLPDVIWLGLLPGLSEELLFRGVMLPALGLTPLGLIVSSLCFGVLHLSGIRQWPYVVWATVIGLVLGGSAIATGNLWVPMVAHVITNLVSSFFWKLREVRATVK
ncbi:MAG: CPBP family intramembrane glutamic endopeptidase [Cyanobacteria bacterium J06648_16]